MYCLALKKVEIESQRERDTYVQTERSCRQIQLDNFTLPFRLMTLLNQEKEGYRIGAQKRSSFF